MFNLKKLATNTGIYAGLLTAGDVICQQLEEQHNRKHLKDARPTQFEWDSSRTKVFALSGVPLGALCHFWYSWLDARFPGKAVRTVLVKTAADQLAFTPVFYLAFFSVCGSFEGKRPREIVDEIKQKALIVYATDSMFWPPNQLFNFYFISPQFRVAYVSAAMLCWNVFLSYSKTSQLSWQKVKNYFFKKEI